MMRLVLISALVAVAFAVPKVQRPKLDGRIVGGETVEITDYPYQVSLLFWGSHICGGSIIGSKWIVTAAHCTDGDDASDLQIRAGSSNLNSGGVVIDVNIIHQNSQYDSWTVDYDITVLELASELPIGSGIAAINLPGLNQVIPAGSNATCSGWGITSEGGSLPNKLQAVVVQIVSNDDCNDAYGGAITPRMCCAGMPGGGKDACQGDSGGPLVVDGLLVGIVSWGYGCARPEYPGVYASVPNLREYITDVAGI